MADQTHLVLARKYRPQKFADVVEQQTAVRVLTNAIQAGRIGSAYLFFGPRGVGKTTLARILAKRVNCQSPEGAEPCNKCESCLAILAGNAMDVMEIDAASQRKIEHVRELRENVKFPPMHGTKKVYIIDEVHMLTQEAFNALLKTLEEPPAHVLFVLATTELQRIPETILSRCQVFTFRKVPIREVQAYLRELCSREKIDAEDEALFWTARRGDGSVRDSLSFLEQAITYSGKKLTAQAVRELVGAIPIELYIKMTQAVLRADSTDAELMGPVEEVFMVGGDLGRFIWEYLDFMRIAVHVRRGSQDTDFLGIPGTDVARIQNELDADPARLTVIFDSIYQLLGRSLALRLRNSYETRVLVEMELLSIREKLSRPSLSGIIQKLNRLSSAVQQGVAYSPEHELQKQFLGTVVDASTIPRLEPGDE